MSDEIIRKCVNKDPVAWEIFLRRYKKLVFSSVKYKLFKLGRRLPIADINDIVQDIFVSIWEKEKLREIENMACIKSWLIMISVNYTSNYCKKNIFNGQFKFFSIDAPKYDDQEKICLADILPSPYADPRKALELSELRSAIESEMAKLSYQEQLILKLNMYEGKKQKDIARIMNLPEGTVASIIQRSKEKLKKSLRVFKERM